MIESRLARHSLSLLHRMLLLQNRLHIQRVLGGMRSFKEEVRGLLTSLKRKLGCYVLILSILILRGEWNAISATSPSGLTVNASMVGGFLGQCLSVWSVIQPISLWSLDCPVSSSGSINVCPFRFDCPLCNQEPFFPGLLTFLGLSNHWDTRIGLLRHLASIEQVNQ